MRWGKREDRWQITDGERERDLGMLSNTCCTANISSDQMHMFGQEYGNRFLVI